MKKLLSLFAVLILGTVMSCNTIQDLSSVNMTISVNGSGQGQAGPSSFIDIKELEVVQADISVTSPDLDITTFYWTPSVTDSFIYNSQGQGDYTISVNETDVEGHVVEKSSILSMRPNYNYLINITLGGTVFIEISSNANTNPDTNTYTNTYPTNTYTNTYPVTNTYTNTYPTNTYTNTYPVTNTYTNTYPTNNVQTNLTLADQWVKIYYYEVPYSLYIPWSQNLWYINNDTTWTTNSSSLSNSRPVLVGNTDWLSTSNINPWDYNYGTPMAKSISNMQVTLYADLFVPAGSTRSVEYKICSSLGWAYGSEGQGSHYLTIPESGGYTHYVSMMTNF